jgi:hypothetical protein
VSIADDVRAPGPASLEARAELARALAGLLGTPGPGHRQLAEALGLPGAPDPAAHAEATVLSCHPYLSVHLGAEGMRGGEAADRVAGFWRALGGAPGPDADHLGSLLELAAELAHREASADQPERQEAWHRARAALCFEHLAPWLVPFTQALAELADPWFDAYAQVLLAWYEDELASVTPTLDQEPDRLPVALAAAPPGLADLGADDVVLDHLVAPIRTGLVLTRLSLARAAQELGVGLRMGERRFLLRSLLEQEPLATWQWLAHEATRWQAAHEAWERRHLADQGCARFWATRAEASRAIFEELGRRVGAGALRSGDPAPQPRSGRRAAGS